MMKAIIVASGMGTDNVSDGDDLQLEEDVAQNKAAQKEDAEDPVIQGPQTDWCVVVDPRSDARLLVRILRSAQKPTVALQPIGESGAYRLTFKTRGPEMDFAVLLYPFREGQPLPRIDVDGGRASLAWPDHTERLTLAPGRDGPTTLTWINP